MTELFNIEHRLEEVAQTIQIVSESLAKTDEKLTILIQGFNTFQDELQKQLSSARIDFGNIIDNQLRSTKKNIQGIQKKIIEHAQTLDLHFKEIEILNDHFEHFKVSVLIPER